jgi:hypothetical protein
MSDSSFSGGCHASLVRCSRRFWASYNQSAKLSVGFGASVAAPPVTAIGLVGSVCNIEGEHLLATAPTL